MNRNQTFAVAILYLIVLLAVGVIYFVHRDWLFFLAFDAKPPNQIPSFGPIPVGVPWFGALGAVVISLTGVFEHKRDWDKDLWPWHVSRPLIGMALAVVSVLIFQSGILAVGSNPQLQSGVPKNLLYYLVAFSVGYREQTFRELMKRLLDVILTPGGGGGGGSPAPKPPTIQGLDRTQAPHGIPTQVVISGTGLTGTQSVKFGDSAAQITANTDTQLTVMTPTVAAAGAVTITVTTKGGSATSQFTFM